MKIISADHQWQEDEHMWYPWLAKPNTWFELFHGVSASSTKGEMRIKKQKISALMAQ